MTAEELYRLAIVCFGGYNILFLITALTDDIKVRDIKDYLLGLTLVFFLIAIYLK